MKTLIFYISSFLVICSISFYQSCRQSDHITCIAFSSFNFNAFDISNAEFKLLKEGDEVYAKKFAFTIEPKTNEVLCKQPQVNIINSAYAYKVDYSQQVFLKDSLKEIEIFSLQDFNAQYPAGAVLNNLFDIPPLTNYAYNYGYSYGVYSPLITLEEIPSSTKDYKFYIKIKTKENQVFIDSLPTIKIKI